MWWVVGLSWGAAVVLAIVVLGFCGYEISWKAARLSKDLSRLRALQAELTTLQTRLAAARARPRHPSGTKT